MEVQEIINVDVSRDLVPLTNDEGLPLAKSMWDMSGSQIWPSGAGDNNCH